MLAFLNAASRRFVTRLSAAVPLARCPGLPVWAPALAACGLLEGAACLVSLSKSLDSSQLCWETACPSSCHCTALNLLKSSSFRTPSASPPPRQQVTSTRCLGRNVPRPGVLQGPGHTACFGRAGQGARLSPALPASSALSPCVGQQGRRGTRELDIFHACGAGLGPGFALQGELIPG